MSLKALSLQSKRKSVSKDAESCILSQRLNVKSGAIQASLMENNVVDTAPIRYAIYSPFGCSILTRNECLSMNSCDQKQ